MQIYICQHMEPYIFVAGLLALYDKRNMFAHILISFAFSFIPRFSLRATYSLCLAKVAFLWLGYWRRYRNFLQNWFTGPYLFYMLLFIFFLPIILCFMCAYFFPLRFSSLLMLPLAPFFYGRCMLIFHLLIQCFRSFFF